MRRALLVLGSALALVGLIPGASAQVVLDNPWLERRVLNIAHQGGEEEAPSDTLFALKTAVRKGADVLEIDVHATSDGEIVVLHDTTVDRTTNGSGRVDQTTLAEIKKLDAAHWFVPGCGTCHERPARAYRYRGYATRARPIPAALRRQGFRPNDFTIPSLREVLRTFPRMLINIEIKRTVPDTAPYEQELADLLAEFGRTTDTIVVSFFDHATERFKLHAPEVHTATGTAETAAFRVSSESALPGTPNPRYVAVQVPMEFEGIQVVSEDFVADAHARGLAVHVWTINDPAEMRRLIAWGVDGIMTDRPTVLESILARRGLRWDHAGHG